MIDKLRDLFRTHGITEYDVKDITTIVNRLLMITPSFETYYRLRDVLTEHLETEPDILKLTTFQGLQTDLARCVVLIAISPEILLTAPRRKFSHIARGTEEGGKIRAQIHCLEHERNDIPICPLPLNFLKEMFSHAMISRGL